MALALAALALAGSAVAASVAPSRTNPGSFPVDRVPQFVCITSDDNYSAAGFKFFVDAFKGKKNASQTPASAGTFDGTNIAMSYYVNSNNGGAYDITGLSQLTGYFKEAVANGSEIGDHTKSHATSSTTSLATWTSEIQAVIDALNKVGVDGKKVVGFRTPFLAYNDNTFKALDGIPQFTYDASIMSGHDAATDGTNFIWPYTLDNGAYSADLATVPKDVTVGKHPGLWECPVYCVIVPPALRKQVWNHRIEGNYTAIFDTTTGKITGMDYNLLSRPGNYGGVGLDSAEFVATLKHSLDLRLKGNRAPMCFTTHSNIFYDQQGWLDEGNTSWNGPGAKSPKATVAQARGAVEDFIAYALTKPEVRLITQENLVKWCENPVAFAGPVGTPVRAARAVAAHAASPKAYDAAGKRVTTPARASYILQVKK